VRLKDASDAYIHIYHEQLLVLYYALLYLLITCSPHYFVHDWSE